MSGGQDSRLFELDEFVTESPTEVKAPHSRGQPAHSAQMRLPVDVQSMVEEFHLVFGLPISSNPTANIPPNLSSLRKRLLSEELDELCEAIDQCDIEAIAAEMADVAYVLYGTALTFGIDLDAVVTEVHESNMSKLDADGNPIVREDGKVLKGPLYRPPDVRNALGIGAS